jgi:hypothetical protein
LQAAESGREEGRFGIPQRKQILGAKPAPSGFAQIDLLRQADEDVGYTQPIDPLAPEGSRVVFSLISSMLAAKTQANAKRFVSRTRSINVDRGRPGRSLLRPMTRRSS